MAAAPDATQKATLVPDHIQEVSSANRKLSGFHGGGYSCEVGFSPAIGRSPLAAFLGTDPGGITFGLPVNGWSRSWVRYRPYRRPARPAHLVIKLLRKAVNSSAPGGSLFPRLLIK
jgi:hypothetical protein